MHADQKFDRPQRRGKHGGARRLIAGLRITHQDEAILAVVRPFFPEADSEGELAYRLWRRGLEVTLAEAVSLGVVPPPGITEAELASLVAQRLLLSVPLLRRTGKLALLGLEASSSPRETSPMGALKVAGAANDEIDEAAATAVVDLGGSAFL
jgi:hypothetical protein